MVKLRYVDSVNLDGGAGGAINQFSIRANGMYDPQVTIGGHKPRGYDQQMVGYDHYTVVGSKIKVTISPAYAQATLINTLPGAFGVILTDNGVFNYANPEEVMEGTQGTAYRTFGYPGNSKVSMSKTFSARKFFGKKYVVGAAEYKGSSGSDPTEQAYFMVWAAGLGGTDPGNLLVTIQVDYIAVLTEPKFIAAS